MNISKLTITPILSQAVSYVIKEPSSERAAMLIKERLVSGANHSPKRVEIYGRMPKFLRGFFNPKSYVGKAVDTYK